MFSIIFSILLAPALYYRIIDRSILSGWGVWKYFVVLIKGLAFLCNIPVCMSGALLE